MFALEQHLPHFDGVVKHFKQEMSAIRVGQTTPALVEEVMVLAYGATSPLKQLASITVSEQRTLVVQPWDKGILKEVEKALFAANLGMTPVIDGGVVRLTMPSLNEERRKEVVKMVNQKLEQTKQSLRKIRDDVREKVMTVEKAKEISEDDKFRLFKEIDKLSTSTAASLQQMADEKSQQVMTI